MICKKCKEDKTVESFKKDPKYIRGYRNICKQCVAERQRIYWKNNPAQYEKHILRVKTYDANKHKGSRHHIKADDFAEMLGKHDGKCWSCKTRDGSVVDHDHKCCAGAYSCGKCVRGILCSQCNTALGLLADNQEHIKNLLAYSLKAEQHPYMVYT